MDFTLSEEQAAVRDLGSRVFRDRARTERVRAIETTPDRFDRELWDELANTGLLGIALPEEHGGAGLGLVACCLVLEQQGAHVAPVPLWPTVVAALAVAEFGAGAQRALLADVVAGTAVLTLALEEFGGTPPEAPDTTAIWVDGHWQLSGTKAAVPHARVSSHALVPAMTARGPALFLVPLAGVAAEPVDTTAHEPAAHLIFDAAPCEHLGDSAALDWLLDRAHLAIAAVQLGVAGSATQQGARYVTERHQFGRPIGSFQAVQHQLADCYLDVEAMRVTLWQAAWRLEAGTDSGTSVRVAAWWAADGGSRVVHRIQHLHGGIGVDVDYPIHRYLLWGKQLAGLLGGAAAKLARLGDGIAS